MRENEMIYLQQKCRKYLQRFAGQLIIKVKLCEVFVSEQNRIHIFQRDTWPSKSIRAYLCTTIYSDARLSFGCAAMRCENLGFFFDFSNFLCERVRVDIVVARK